MRLVGEQRGNAGGTRMTDPRTRARLVLSLLAGPGQAQEAIDTPFNDHVRLTAGLLSATADTIQPGSG